MGLEDKLNNIIEKPINDKVKTLQSEKDQLELIYGSLSLMSRPYLNIGKGMKEYSNDVKESYKNSAGKIESIISQKKEFLDSIGIKNIDDLVNNEDYNKEKEVVEFNEEKTKDDELKKADSKLIDRLKELGVVIEGDFSYENIEKKAMERIKLLDNEIIEEKLKTKTGKEEVVNDLSKEISKLFLENFTYGEFRYAFFEIFLDGGSTSIIVPAPGNYRPRLTRTLSFGSKGMQNDIIEIKAKYGKEILLESAKKAFLDKFETIKIVDNSQGNKPELSYVKEKGADIFCSAIKLELVDRELQNNKELSKILSVEKMNMYGYATKEINDFENNTQQAKEFLKQLLEKEASIPKKGKVKINSLNNSIIIDISEEIGSDEKILRSKEENYYRLLREKTEFLNKKPKYFGMKKWEQELSEKEKALEKLKTEKEQFSLELEKLKNTQLPRFDIKNLKNTEIYSVINNVTSFTLNESPKDIFEKIKIRCNEILSRKMPDLLVKLKEYLDLNNSMN